MKKIIYLDNNATTQVDKSVEKEMRKWQTSMYGNPSSLHFFGQQISKVIEKVRLEIAEKINCEPDEIIFTVSGSEGNNLCIKGFCEANKEKGKHIITSSVEHPSVINTCKHLEEQGFEITYLPVDREGFVSPKELEKAIKSDTILVSIMHAQNEIGTIQDIENFVKICSKHNVSFHIDAVQSFLKLPLDVKELGLSMATFSGHKIHAPKGIGFIFKRRDIKIRRQIDGGGQEFGLRSGTENTAYIVGLSKAIKLFSNKDIEKMRVLQKFLIIKLSKMKNILLNGTKDLTKRICNNINISVENVEGEHILNELSKKGICVSTGSACSSKSTKVSPILKAVNCPSEFIHGNIRISISKFTSQKDIKEFFNAFVSITNSRNYNLKMNTKI